MQYLFKDGSLFCNLKDIKIKRITKFDLNKAKKDILKLEDKIKEVKNNLDNLTDYAIDYFKELKKNYGNSRKRKTEINLQPEGLSCLCPTRVPCHPIMKAFLFLLFFDDLGPHMSCL